MAGRKQAVGNVGSGAHTRQDAGISKGSLTTRRSSLSQAIPRFSKPSESISAGIPHLTFFSSALKILCGMPMRPKTAWNVSQASCARSLAFGT